MDDLVARAAEAFHMPPADALRIMLSAPRRYKVYAIPKRKAGEFRTIAQPAREVKAFQRWLLDDLRRHLPVHSAATAYVTGTGIRDNVLPHVANEFLFKADFKDFFPSITARDFKRHLEKYGGDGNRLEVDLLCSLLFWRPRGESSLRLSIGAPSSPFLSNTILYDFDVTMAEACRGLGVTYTRYADDIAFSAGDHTVLRRAAGFLSELCARLDYPRLTLNPDKTLFLSRKHARRLTGLILANDGSVSIGRDRKRQVRAMMHHFASGRLSPEQAMELRGLLAFIHDVEPGFLETLRSKYGDAALHRIFQH